MEEVDTSKYKDSLELQVSEIEMLKSMFPDGSEFCIEDDQIGEIKAFIQGSDVLPQRIEFSIHLTNDKGKVSLHAALPTCYPYESPDIYVRSDQFSRQSQFDLNLQLTNFLHTFGEGNLIIGSAVAWLQEHAQEFLMNIETPCYKEKTQVPKDDTFLRLWIYSHHIYSKVKRKDIKDLAEQFQLTGFCIPGKPGVICVEGLSHNALDWWHTVRSWNWQKILCKKQEEKKMNTPDDFTKLRRFQDFQELGSDNNIRIKSSGFHVDMGDLFRFLDQHKCGYMFEELFGVKGK